MTRTTTRAQGIIRPAARKRPGRRRPGRRGNARLLRVRRAATRLRGFLGVPRALGGSQPGFGSHALASLAWAWALACPGHLAGSHLVLIALRGSHLAGSHFGVIAGLGVLGVSRALGGIAGGLRVAGLGVLGRGGLFLGRGGRRRRFLSSARAPPARNAMRARQQSTMVRFFFMSPLLRVPGPSHGRSIP